MPASALDGLNLDSITGLRCQRDGRVLTLCFDDPPRNYLTPALVKTLERIVRRLHHDRSIGTVILTGAGNQAFSTHFHPDAVGPTASSFSFALSARSARFALALARPLSRVAPLASVLGRTPAAGLLHLERLRQLHLGMSSAPQVFIAAVNGAVMGASLELALACDIRLAAEGTYPVGFTEAHFGISLPAGGARRLAQIVGPARALELLLEGTVLEPEQAHRLGLFERLVEHTELMPQARATAARLARRAPASVQAYKAAVHRGLTQPLPAALRLEQAFFAAAASRRQAQRAMRTYAQQLSALGDRPFDREAILGPWERGEMADVVGKA